MFAQPSAAALNHLLAQNDWALTRLARFAGKTARFDIAPFSFACTILADGTLRSAAADATADAVCVIAPSLLPRLALHDEKAQADIRTAGDAALLSEIFSVSRSLRWDAAKDLGRVAGDTIAERIVQTAQGTRQHLHDAALNLSKAAAAYCTEEHPLLARPQQVAAFKQQVDKLRDDVARLEERIKQLPAARDR
jgi:ubiquinone biosynthesis protein UbiJ